MKYEDACDFLLNKLKAGLPTYITYHDVQHTKDVISASEHLAAQENVTGEDLILLKTAALFHDSGFLQNHKEHEMLSCRIARKHLPDFEYSEAQIEKICAMIMSTKLPQSGNEPLSRLLCDADLFYLGGDQYEEKADRLFHEFKRHGIVKNRAEWELQQAHFLSGHQYFTRTALAERDFKKQENMRRIQERISGTMPHHPQADMGEVVKDTFFLLLGVFLAGIALKFFLVPNKFFDGGVTGVALLLHELYHLNLAMMLILLNLPLIAVSWVTVGRLFALRTLLGVILLGACLWVLPDLALTSDKLLISIFGGVFLGIGIGLVMRAGAALDGLEVLALYTLKRTSFTITEIILGINVLIFTIAAFSFGVETALYSILTYFAATRMIDYVVEGIQAYTGVTIISGKSEVIKYELVNTLGRGITIYKGERGFLPGKFDVSAECDIVFTVITRLELRKLKNLVYDADPHAFVFANTIREAAGGIIKRRRQH